MKYLFRYPWEFEHTLAIFLHLTESWIDDAPVASVGLIAQAERISHDLVKITLSRLRRAGLLTLIWTYPRGWRLSRAPSLISLWEAYMAASVRDVQFFFRHLLSAYGASEIRMRRPLRGQAWPNAVIADRLTEAVRAELTGTSLAQALAVHLGLTRVSLFSAAPQAPTLNNLWHATKFILRDFAPLSEIVRGELIAWCHTPVSGAVLIGFRRWLRSFLPAGQQRLKHGLQPADARRLREAILQAQAQRGGS